MDFSLDINAYRAGLNFKNCHNTYPIKSHYSINIYRAAFHILGFYSHLVRIVYLRRELAHLSCFHRGPASDRVSYLI